MGSQARTATFALGALVALGASAFALRPHLWDDRATGRVVALDVRRRGACYPTIEFEAAGKTRRTEATVGENPCPFRLDQEVVVAFRPENPDDAAILDGGRLFWAGGTGLLALVFGALAFSSSRGRPPARSLAERMRFPRGPLADAPLGPLVGMRGTFRSAHPTLEAPLTGRPCAAWYVEVRPTHEAEGAPRKRWKLRAFEIHDGRRVLVCEAGIPLVVELARRRAGRVDHAPSPALAEILAAAGATGADADPTQNDLTWSEGILEEGDVVTLYGRAQAADAGEAAERLTLLPPEGGAYALVADPPPAAEP